MKYVLIIFTLLCISLTLTLFTVTGIIPNVNGLNLLNANMTDSIDVTAGKSITEMKSNSSFANAVLSFSNLENQYSGKTYTSMSLADQSALYLQSGMDFPTGLYYFFNYIIKGAALLYPILIMLGMPNQIIWFIMTPISFMFILAIIQFISGRSFEANK